MREGGLASLGSFRISSRLRRAASWGDTNGELVPKHWPTRHVDQATGVLSKRAAASASGHGLTHRASLAPEASTLGCSDTGGDPQLSVPKPHGST